MSRIINRGGLILIMGTLLKRIRVSSYMTARASNQGPRKTGALWKRFFGTEVQCDYKIESMQFGTYFLISVYSILIVDRLCIMTPREGARLYQAGDEKLLELARKCESIIILFFVV